PKGTDPFSITFALVFGAKAVISALLPKLPTVNSGAGKQGAGLDEAAAKGNKVKLNSLKTEIAGFAPERFGDYANPARRYFTSDPREQRIEMLLFIGKGSYQKPDTRVKVGQTTLLSLGADARFNFYEPGADLSGEPAHLNWYPAPEVGASSSGAAGLELTTTFALTFSPTASTYIFSGNSVIIPSGAGSFPSNWVSGLVLRIGAPYPFNVSDATGDAGRDVIQGSIGALGFVPGDSIEIGGDNAGLYTVHSADATNLQLDYVGGAPATGLTLGSTTSAISFAGLRFRTLSVSANSIVVERLRADGTVDEDWIGWPDRTTNQAQIQLDPSNAVGGYRGPFPACPENELITKIQFNMLFARGLIGVGSKGDYYTIPSVYFFEYRDMALGGAWTAIQYTSTGQTLDALGFTWTIDLPYPMRPECRMRRNPKPSTEWNDDVTWYSLSGLMASQSRNSYPGMTTLAVDIRGGDRISSQSESLVSCSVTRILPVLRNGVWTSPQPTREISAWVGYIMRDVGYSDTQDLDIAELERLEREVWTPRGMTYDKIITDVDTVKGMLQECLIPGFSEFTLGRGVIKPCFDGPRGEIFQAMYNPENMREALSREVTGPALPDQFDGVDVKYYSHATRQNETVSCRFSGEPGGTRVREVTLEGVGDETQAWRYGMRVLRKLRYQTETFDFETELDALNSEYDDFVGLGDMTPQYGQASRMEGYADLGTSRMVEVLDALDWSVPGEHRVLIRRKDGSASGPYVATRVDDYRFTIPTLDFVPDLSGEYEPPFIQFGHKDNWIYRALIRDINPSGTKTCSVTAVNYDERIYADDFNFPPA
ncbi:host specificity factor TipJ family phage tail protein, partial [Pseudomonas tolaasii]